ncbi:MAG TPA: STAS domain-containing protein [Ktedonobacterales bacterium]|jgi:anti-anti-sigma factor
MSAQHLEARVRHEPGVAVVELRGDIAAFAEDTLNAAYTEAEQQGADPILLNFSQVQYINSTGIALIVGLLARARKTRRQLLACGLSQHYIEIFQITRLVDFMNVFPDESSARSKGQISSGAQQSTHHPHHSNHHHQATDAGHLPHRQPGKH